MRASTSARIAELLKIPVERRRESGPLGKQVRSDITTILRLTEHAITAGDRDNARRQGDRLVQLAREAKSSCGQFRPMAKLITLARGAGLYPQKATSR